MTKKRPVIVVSPRLPYRSEIVTVIPLSTTAPRHTLPFVVKLSKNCHPSEPDEADVWAKCDMVTNLSLARLSAFKVGRRKYTYPIVIKEDMQLVKEGILHGIGMGDLITRDESSTL